MIPHIVRQGDYFTSLAARVGVDAEEAWADAANDEIRERRQDMDQLRPGDIVYLPEGDPQAFSLSVGSDNEYTAQVTMVPIAVRLSTGLEENVFADATYRIEPLGEEEHTTDGEGWARFEVPSYLHEVRLVFEAIERDYRIAVGHMDPIEEGSGIDMRLHHLGYIHGSLVGLPREQAELRRRTAIETFQRDQELEVTGEVDDATRDALLAAHEGASGG
ncbi:MAG: peptidoglycan-binding domain-containing protein [Myxococcota bacterium]